MLSMASGPFLLWKISKTLPLLSLGPLWNLSCPEPQSHDWDLTQITSATTPLSAALCGCAPINLLYKTENGLNSGYTQDDDLQTREDREMRWIWGWSSRWSRQHQSKDGEGQGQKTGSHQSRWELQGWHHPQEWSGKSQYTSQYEYSPAPNPRFNQPQIENIWEKFYLTQPVQTCFSCHLVPIMYSITIIYIVLGIICTLEMI